MTTTETPQWVLEVIRDLAAFAQKNKLSELCCDLEWLYLKYSGQAAEATIAQALIDANFTRPTQVRLAQPFPALEKYQPRRSSGRG